ncbi:hypothetical protein C5167_037478 [Papaver somniferum]|uniref:Uncharacterized protein n=1 Tax=Papaver somniferum TaxID=3469 RepID=A0A4Y7I6G7_PAPSO|nr:hypothetical protein C5167_037478 [Papaver somniferum]
MVEEWKLCSQINDNRRFLSQLQISFLLINIWSDAKSNMCAIADRSSSVIPNYQVRSCMLIMLYYSGYTI